jgi:hypothetical protein
MKRYKQNLNQCVNPNSGREGENCKDKMGGKKKPSDSTSLTGLSALLAAHPWEGLGKIEVILPHYWDGTVRTQFGSSGGYIHCHHFHFL